MGGHVKRTGRGCRNNEHYQARIPLRSVAGRGNTA